LRQNIGVNESAAAPSTLADASLAELLREDVPYGDRTTEALGIGDVEGSLSFVARGAMVVCGTEEAARLFQLCGAEAHVQARTGARGAAQSRLLRASGDAQGLLKAWKVATR
jgi:molybdenum transport protein